MNCINSKKLFIKRLLFTFLCFHSLFIVAQEKRISLREENVPLEQVFLEIERQTGYSIAYSERLLDAKKRVSIELDHQTIEEAFSMLLSGTGSDYKIVGYHVIISPAIEQKENRGGSEKIVQIIRGVVTNSKNDQPIPYASVVLSDSWGSMTDSLGMFRLEAVPVGRYDLQVSCLGYQTYKIPEVLVTSSKEVFLKILLEEKPMELEDVVIRPKVNKEETLNKMALAGGRMIHMEETSRFANGFDDPARLASVFPGAAGSIGTNALAIRGNSPLFNQWRIEGMEVPNPNHFSDVMGVGGGFLSGLSTHTLGNSDFYNGTLPAEYSNALAAVFDMFIRNGNNQRYEHAFQVGLLGIDLGSEGPLGRKNSSAYLFNYRFSNTSLVTSNDYDMKYQDLTFKFHIPTQRAGEFSIWGVGLNDINKDEALDQVEWETAVDRQNRKIEQKKMLLGVNHTYRPDKKTVLRSFIGANYQKDELFIDLLDDQLHVIPIGMYENAQWQFNLGSSVERWFSDKHVNKTGITFNGLRYDLDYEISPNIGLNEPARRIAKGNGESTVLSFYSQSLIRLNKQWTATLGLTSQLFTLTDRWTLEPRLALKWHFHPRHSVTTSYGLHAQREKLDYYFLDMADIHGNNKDLDFSKAHHWGITYSWAVSDGLHFKVEPYYQHLYDIPVERGTSFSVINNDVFYMDRLLTNDGKGRNYGVDVTLERYLHNGYYYMFTGSLFKSTYRGGDRIWRPTMRDKRYILNVVAGKEWMTGRNKQNMFNLNIRLSIQGGDRYTPVDEERSHLLQYIEWDETRAFSKQFKPALTGDLSAIYRINKPKVSHEFGIKILNVGGYTGTHGYLYNEKFKTIDKIKGLGLIPNLSYKLYF